MSPIWRRLSVLTLILLASLPRAEATELTDHGALGEYFYDVATGLYWFDPAVFAGQPRIITDNLVAHSSVWSWATSAQVEALLDKTAPTGVSLESVLGLRQATIGVGGPRWIGFHAGTEEPNGWLIQSDDEPDYRTVTETGFQGSAEALGAGSWLVASADPVAAPRLENVGDAGEFFHDRGTGLYWCDPATFVGLSRSDVENWITEHSNWRWASAAEVYALLGKMAVDDGDLTSVLGAPQAVVGTGWPRWLGYHGQATQPDGLLLEANLTPMFHLLNVGGAQSNVVNWNPGAWVTSEINPTPVESTTWGAVKARFR